jgi:hypothetical protein
MLYQSIPQIADVHILRGATAPETARPDLLFEIPHGATPTTDFLEVAGQVKSSLPEGLVDFFHVNTDVGAFEVAHRAAEHLVKLAPDRCVSIVRCRIPRTFIDCNRRIEASAEAFKEGRVTPGLMPWLTHPEDLAMLRERYEAYMGVVNETTGQLATHGSVVLVHTYAPRQVDVQVDEDIVKNLRRAYEPEVEPTWPLRPEIDVISRDAEGNDHAPRALVEALRREYLSCEWPLTESATYPLHPSTMAWDHVMARPGRALCIEYRRDLLADPFDPFVEMNICPQKVDRVALPLARALNQWR